MGLGDTPLEPRFQAEAYLSPTRASGPDYKQLRFLQFVEVNNARCQKQANQEVLSCLLPRLLERLAYPTPDLPFRRHESSIKAMSMALDKTMTIMIWLRTETEREPRVRFH